MSADTEYEHYLEQLIIKTLLPVYEQYCKEQGLDIYKSGIPLHLLTLSHTAKVAALFKKKQSGR